RLDPHRALRLAVQLLVHEGEQRPGRRRRREGARAVGRQRRDSPQDRARLGARGAGRCEEHRLPRGRRRERGRCEVSASFSTRLLGLGLLSLSDVGCGARSYVAAPGAKYPVSLSSAVRGPDGKILSEDDTQKLGTFKMDYTACSMLWTLI